MLRLPCCGSTWAAWRQVNAIGTRGPRLGRCPRAEQTPGPIPARHPRRTTVGWGQIRRLWRGGSELGESVVDRGWRQQELSGPHRRCSIPTRTTHPGLRRLDLQDGEARTAARRPHRRFRLCARSIGIGIKGPWATPDLALLRVCPAMFPPRSSPEQRVALVPCWPGAGRRVEGHARGSGRKAPGAGGRRPREERRARPVPRRRRGRAGRERKGPCRRPSTAGTASIWSRPSPGIYVDPAIPVTPVLPRLVPCSSTFTIPLRAPSGHCCVPTSGAAAAPPSCRSPILGRKRRDPWIYARPPRPSCISAADSS